MYDFLFGQRFPEPETQSAGTETKQLLGHQVGRPQFLGGDGYHLFLCVFYATRCATTGWGLIRERMSCVTKTKIIGTGYCT